MRNAPADRKGTIMTDTEGTEARRSDGEETSSSNPSATTGAPETKPLDLPRATIG